MLQTGFTPDSQVKGGWKTRSSWPLEDDELLIPAMDDILTCTCGLFHDCNGHYNGNELVILCCLISSKAMWEGVDRTKKWQHPG